MSPSQVAPPNAVTLRLVPALEPADDATQLEDERARAVFFDHQTGLISRPLCLNRLEHALADTSRHKPGLAVVAVAPDGEPPHGAWPDAVLACLAGRLQAGLRAADTPAHFGHGLFIVIITDISSALDAARVAQRLIEGVQLAVVDKGGFQRPVTVSAGVALSRFCGAAPLASNLIEEAGQALRGARSVRPAFVHVVTPHDHEDSDELSVGA